MSIQDEILAKMRRGEPLSEDDRVAQITDMDELYAYRIGRGEAKTLTSEALAAIVARENKLQKRWKA